MPWPETWSSRSDWVLACHTVTAEMYAECFQTCMPGKNKQDNSIDGERNIHCRLTHGVCLHCLHWLLGWAEKSPSAATDVDWGWLSGPQGPRSLWWKDYVSFLRYTHFLILSTKITFHLWSECSLFTDITFHPCGECTLSTKTTSHSWGGCTLSTTLWWMQRPHSILMVNALYPQRPYSILVVDALI